MAIGTGTALLGGALVGGLASNSASKRAASAVGGASDAATAEQRRQFDIATGLARPGIDAGNTARNQLMRLLGMSPTASNARAGMSGGFAGQDQVMPQRLRDQFGLDSRFGGRQIPKINTPWMTNGSQPDPVSPTESASPTDMIMQTPGYQFIIDQKMKGINATRAGSAGGGAYLKDLSNYVHGSTANQFYQDYANRLAGLAGSAQTASGNLGALGVHNGANVANTMLNAGNARASGILGSSNAFNNVLGQLGQYAGQGYFDNLFGGGGGNSTTMRPGGQS